MAAAAPRLGAGRRLAAVRRLAAAAARAAPGVSAGAAPGVGGEERVAAASPAAARPGAAGRALLQLLERGPQSLKSHRAVGRLVLPRGLRGCGDLSATAADAAT